MKTCSNPECKLPFAHSYPCLDTNLSDLPISSVVRVDRGDEGTWMKLEDGVWEELFAHCIDCIRMVHESGVDEKHLDHYGGYVTTKPAAEFFGEYTILAFGVKK